MIDLHLHTTASDGRSAPDDLVREAAAAGLTTIAVTDHDTTAALADVARAAGAHGLDVVAGIEITAVYAGRDVHMLAYFLDPTHAALETFLERQRADRRRRLFEMVSALARVGAPIDEEALRARAQTGAGRALGRPMLADALVLAGHARSIADAFDRFLGEDRPAFIAREGAAPPDVIALVADAGGLTSLAHPGKLRQDDLIPSLVDAGMPAIEVHHPDHDRTDARRYAELASTYDLLITGGSDYHGVGSGRAAALGQVTLPPLDFARLAERAGWSSARA